MGSAYSKSGVWFRYHTKDHVDRFLVSFKKSKRDNETERKDGYRHRFMSWFRYRCLILMAHATIDEDNKLIAQRNLSIKEVESSIGSLEYSKKRIIDGELAKWKGKKENWFKTRVRDHAFTSVLKSVFEIEKDLMKKTREKTKLEISLNKLVQDKESVSRFISNNEGTASSSDEGKTIDFDSLVLEHYDVVKNKSKDRASQNISKTRFNDSKRKMKELEEKEGKSIMSQPFEIEEEEEDDIIIFNENGAEKEKDDADFEKFQNKMIELFTRNATSDNSSESSSFASSSSSSSSLSSKNNNKSKPTLNGL